MVTKGYALDEDAAKGWSRIHGSQRTMMLCTNTRVKYTNQCTKEAAYLQMSAVYT
jgi:hypothetical protein